MSDEIRELTREDFERALPRRQRERIMRGELEGGEDVIALRRFTGLTQQAFADALGIGAGTAADRGKTPGRAAREPAGLGLKMVGRTGLEPVTSTV